MKKRITCLLLVVSIILSTMSFHVSAQAKTKLTLGVGMNKKLTVSGKKVKWTSNNKRVAKVASDGRIYARKKGKATIVAKVKKKKVLTCVVKVREQTKEEKVFFSVNKYRKENGLVPLVWDDQLLAPATIRATEASQYWSHIRPDGRAWNTVSRHVHGENLGRKFEEPDDIMQAWMNSPGHKENILRADFRRIAVATYRSTDSTIYWCQSFGY